MVDSAAPSRPPGTAPLHLLLPGRFRCAVPPSGHGSAASPTSWSIPLRRPALRARLRCISYFLVDSAAPSRPPGTAPLHLLVEIDGRVVAEHQAQRAWPLTGARDLDLPPDERVGDRGNADDAALLEHH